MKNNPSDEIQEITVRKKTEVHSAPRRKAAPVDTKRAVAKQAAGKQTVAGQAAVKQASVPRKSIDTIPVKRSSLRSGQIPEISKPTVRAKTEATVKPEAVAKPEAVSKPRVSEKTTNPARPIPAVKPEAKRKPKPEVTQAKAEENPENLEPQPVEPEVQKKKKSSPQKVILTIIIIIAACGLAFSGYKLFTIFHGYKEGADAYKEIERQIKPTPSSPNKEDEEDFSINVSALKNLNVDAQGYLHCEGLLSYPVTQCGDNDYYLTHLFNGEWNSCGCLFIDCNLPEGFESRNCIIYGHNMNDGSMFASLYKYDDEEFYQQHKEFDVFTEGHHYIYKVFSLFITPVDGFVYTYDFASDEDFVNFLNVAAGCSPYETDYGELTADRKVITMSTCLGNNDEENRFVVMLIRDREVVD